jgi:hypothetical protein
MIDPCVPISRANGHLASVEAGADAVGEVAWDDQAAASQATNGAGPGGSVCWRLSTRASQVLDGQAVLAIPPLTIHQQAAQDAALLVAQAGRGLGDGCDHSLAILPDEKGRFDPTRLGQSTGAPWVLPWCSDACSRAVVWVLG